MAIIRGSSRIDILNGGDEDDDITGGLGLDIVSGGDSGDRITMLVTTGNGDMIDAGVKEDTLVLSGVVPGDHEVVVDLSSLTDQVVSIGGVTDVLAQINFEYLDASGISGFIHVTGSADGNSLIGSNGHDILSGGLGVDSVFGGAGNDRVEMEVTFGGEADYADGGAGLDTLALVGDVDGSYVEVDLSSVIDQVVSFAGVVDMIVQNNFEHLDASQLSEVVLVTGSAGANTVIGSSFADTIHGGAGNDRLDGGAGADELYGEDGHDVIVIGAAADHELSEVIDGGAGLDTIWFTSTADGDTLVLNANTTGVERVVLADAAGLTTGTTTLHVDASNVTTGLSLTGNAGFNALTGTSGNDIINGGAGHDSLDGGSGTDTMIGGAGNDSFSMNSATDVVLEGLNAGVDTVYASIDYTLTANVEELFLQGAAVSGTGNGLNNMITGNDVANTLFGLAGHDILIGYVGQDIVLGGTGNDRVEMRMNAGDEDTADGGVGLDTLALVGDVDGDGAVVVELSSLTDQVTRIGMADPDTLVQKNFEHLDASLLIGSVQGTGSAGANTLIGTVNNDVLNGMAGNDRLVGGTGTDTLNGGDGHDVIVIGAAADHELSEVIDGGAGLDTIRFTSTVDGDLLVLNGGVTGVEHVVIADAAGLTTGTTTLHVNASNVTTGLSLTGNAGNNELTGTSGNDILNGGAGNDLLNGGDGIDMLIGGAGNDYLYGADGFDTLNGGGGDDLFSVNDATAVVLEGLNAGIDTVQAGIDYTLTAHVEHLQVVGFAVSGTGNGLNNTITGNDVSNTLFGLAGHDILIGGVGQDIVDGGTGNDRVEMRVSVGDVDEADGGTGLDTLALVGDVDGDGVVVVLLSSLTDQVTRIGTADPDTVVQKNFEHLDASGLTTGSVQVTGSAGANILIGSGSPVDSLNAGDGHDVILIRAGADHGNDEAIHGGAGLDTIRFTSTVDGDVLLLGFDITGVEHVVIADAAGFTTGTTILHVDASNVTTGLSLTGNAGWNELTGSSGNDIINGGAGDDTLEGGLGTDTMIGGAGSDLFHVREATDVVLEGLNAGYDSVRSYIDDYTLTAHVEDLFLQGAAVSGTGNNLNNVIEGTGAANTLSGLAGDDDLSGGVGQDTVHGGTGNDHVWMRVSAGDVDEADGGTGLDTLALLGDVDGDGVVVVDLSSLTDQVTRIGTADPDTLVQKNFEHLDASGLTTGSVSVSGSAGANTLIGMDGEDTLSGGAGNDWLEGGEGMDMLDGGGGDDTLNGGIGNDTFVFDWGDGDDLILDNSGSADRLLFTSGIITPLDLVISQQVNDLRIAIHGTSDEITVKDWFVGTANRIETIQTSDGQTLLSTQVNQLIQAMAGFTAQTGLTWDQAIADRPAEVQAIVAATW